MIYEHDQLLLCNVVSWVPYPYDRFPEQIYRCPAVLSIGATSSVTNNSDSIAAAIRADDFLCSPSAYCNWSNNPFMLHTKWWLAEIAPRHDAASVSVPVCQRATCTLFSSGSCSLPVRWLRHGGAASLVMHVCTSVPVASVSRPAAFTMPADALCVVWLWLWLQAAHHTCFECFMQDIPELWRGRPYVIAQGMGLFKHVDYRKYPNGKSEERIFRPSAPSSSASPSPSASLAAVELAPTLPSWRLASQPCSWKAADPIRDVGPFLLPMPKLSCLMLVRDEMDCLLETLATYAAAGFLQVENRKQVVPQCFAVDLL